VASDSEPRRSGLRISGLRGSCILIIDEDFLEMTGIKVPRVSRGNRRRVKGHGDDHGLVFFGMHTVELFEGETEGVFGCDTAGGDGGWHRVGCALAGVVSR
jgi:hypothetical protein